MEVKKFLNDSLKKYIEFYDKSGDVWYLEMAEKTINKLKELV